MLIYYINTAIRSLIRFRTNSIINIIGLSFGLSAALVITLYVVSELQVDKFNTNIDRIYRVELNYKDGSSANMPEIVARKIAEELPEVEKYVRFNWGEDYNILKYKNNTLLLNNFVFVDSSVFDIFSFSFIQGNPNTALKQPFSVVLTESSAKKIFGSEDPMNKTITYYNFLNFTVTGIIKDIKDFHLPINALATYQSFTYMNGGGNLDYNNWSHLSYLMLRKPGNDIKFLESKIYRAFKKTDYWKEAEPRFSLRKLSEIYFSKDVSAGYTKYGNLQLIYILSAICICILILVSINFINLEFSKILVKQADARIKKIIGSRNIHLYLQLYTEIFILTFISGLIAFFLIALVQSFFAPVMGVFIHQIYSFKGLLILLLLTFALSLFLGLYFSFRAPYSIKQCATGKNRLGPKNLLVLFQFLISLVLIIATSVVYKQLFYLKNSELGFTKENIVTVQLNTSIIHDENKSHTFKENLLKNPGITQVSFACLEPGTTWWSAEVESEGYKIGANVNSVDPEYLNTLNLKLIEGRNFSLSNKSEQGKTFILNECAIKHLNLESPIGKTIKCTMGQGTIIGIIKDFHFNSLHSTITPLVFYNDNRMYTMALIKVQPLNQTQTLAHIRHVWEELSPDFPLDIKFLNNTFDSQFKADELFSKLLVMFTFLALLIACLGIYGISLFCMEQRTKEIGIRKVNGARITEVMVMLNKDFIKWVALAFAIACPIAWYAMHKWLENFAYKTELSWWVFAAAGFMALLIALVTVSWQSWRAATRNPVESLRYE